MRQYLDANCEESPIPTTLTIEYDEESIGPIPDGVPGVHAQKNEFAPTTDKEMTHKSQSYRYNGTENYQSQLNGMMHGNTNSTVNGVVENGR